MGRVICLLLLALVSLASCEKKEGPVVIDTSINIMVLDKESNNQLEGDRFNIDDLKIYYLVNGEKKFYFKGWLDAPRGYAVNDNAKNQPLLTIFLNDDVNSPVTLIEYNKSDTDTIRSEFIRKGPSVFVTKVWYNDQLAWESKNGSTSFSITKDF